MGRPETVLTTKPCCADLDLTEIDALAGMPRYARSRGRTVIQINPEATRHDEIAQYVLRGKVGEVLPALLHATWPHSG